MKKKEIEIRDLFIEIRKFKKLTQEDFGKTLKVSRSTIAKIENKEIFVSDKLLGMFFLKYRSLLKPYSIFVYSDETGKTDRDFEPKTPTLKEKIFIKFKDFFEDVEEFDTISSVQNTYNNPNTEFKKNMERLAFLERENETLKEKLKIQNDYIKSFINKDV